MELEIILMETGASSGGRATKKKPAAKKRPGTKVKPAAKKTAKRKPVGL